MDNSAERYVGENPGSYTGAIKALGQPHSRRAFLRGAALGLVGLGALLSDPDQASAHCCECNVSHNHFSASEVLVPLLYADERTGFNTPDINGWYPYVAPNTIGSVDLIRYRTELGPRVHLSGYPRSPSNNAIVNIRRRLSPPVFLPFNENRLVFTYSISQDWQDAELGASFPLRATVNGRSNYGSLVTADVGIYLGSYYGNKLPRPGIPHIAINSNREQRTPFALVNVDAFQNLAAGIVRMCLIDSQTIEPMKTVEEIIFQGFGSRRFDTTVGLVYLGSSR